ncbi:hypothetical protein RCL1_001379 [Eukaryota sp. TZLM3-RCL]
MVLPPYSPTGTALVNRKLRPISFYSNALTEAQRKRPTIKQQLFAIVKTLTSSAHESLLKSRRFELHTDHNNLVFLLNQSKTNAHVSRWQPLLADFEFDIHHIAGQANLWADLLSRQISKSEIKVHNIIEVKKDLDNQNSKNTEVTQKLMSTLHRETGHPGKSRTLKLMNEHGFTYTPALKLMARNMIDECNICQKFDHRPEQSRTGHSGTLMGESPFQCLHVNTMGTFSADHEGKKYVQLFSCNFTRYSILVPPPSNTAVDVASSLLTRVIPYFGIPAGIHSDNGPELQNAGVKALLTSLRINSTYSSSYFHESNGLAERRNKEILDTVRKIVTKHNCKEHWSSVILMHYWLCSLEPDAWHTLQLVETYTIISSKTDSGDNLDNRGKGAKWLDCNLKTVWNLALKQQSKCCQLQRTSPIFKSGDLVLKVNAGNIKFLKHLGPYQIKEIIGSSGYRVCSIISDHEYVVSQHELTAFRPILLNDDAKHLAASDIAEFVVEKVIDHTDDLSSFLVKFLNGPTLWQPLETLREHNSVNQALTDYVNCKKLMLPPRKRKQKERKKDKKNWCYRTDDVSEL